MLSQISIIIFFLQLQGMRENLERVLQFMATKRIRMHAITSREVLEGNLKSVMRLILALAAHYKPQSVRHHENSTIPPANTTPSNNNNHSPKNQSLNQTYENVTVSKSQTNDTSRKFEGKMFIYLMHKSKCIYVFYALSVRITLFLLENAT